MSIEDAAKSLTERLKDCIWFVAVGETADPPRLIVYTTAASAHWAGRVLVGKAWKGFPVAFVKMGRPKPATGTKL